MQGHSAVPAATRKRRGGGWAIALVLINTSGPPSMGTINYVTSLAEPVRAQQDRGWRDFTLCTRWARCPLRLLARGARRGRAAGAPASASPAAARWHKRAGQPRHHGRAEMGCPGWVSGRIHPAMLLCAPRPARGRWVAGTPPRPPGLAVRSPCSGQWSLLSGSTPLLWHHGPSPVHPGGHRGLRWRKTGLRDGHDGCQEGSWVAPSPGSAAKGAREVHGPLRGVSGSSAHMRALTLTAALGAAGVVPPGRACTGGRWAFLALAVCLPRLQGRKRG